MEDLNKNPSPRQSAEASGRNFTFLIVYLAGLSAFGSFMNDMYVPALPEMATFFHCSTSTSQLGLTFGMVGLAIGQFILGPVSDRVGRKPVLIISLAVFIAGAVISVFSPDIYFFLGCRFFQGLGASGGYFLARTIPADLFFGRQLAKVMALIGAINGLAPASAPVIGGFVAHTSGWKGIFWILAAFCALLLFYAFRFRESLSRQNRVKGSLWASFAGYAVLLKNKRFMIHVMLKGSALGVLFAYISSAPFIMQTHFGYDELQFGLFMGLNALFVAAGATLALKFRALRRASLVGGIISLVSVGLQIPVLWTGKSFWAYEILLLPMLAGLGMIFTVGNTLAMDEGRTQAGDASAVLGIAGYFFGAVVAPLVGIGDVLRSTAVTCCILAVIVLVFAILSRRLPVLSEMESE